MKIIPEKPTDEMVLAGARAGVDQLYYKQNSWDRVLREEEERVRTDFKNFARHSYEAMVKAAPDDGGPVLTHNERELLSGSRDLAEKLEDTEFGESIGKVLSGLCAVIDKLAPGGVILNTYDFMVESVVHIIKNSDYGSHVDLAKKILSLVGIEDWRKP